MLKRNIKEKPRKKKGQSTVEYIILVAAVIAALLAFFGSSGAFSPAFNTTLSDATSGMVNMAGRLSGSRPLAP